MNKKLLSLFLALTLLTCLFSGCSKKDEYGTVGDAEITIEEQDDGIEPTIFTKLDNPFTEYDYENVQFECAKFSFDVPKTWEQQIYNCGCIRYDAPKDDPIFPGATCYVRCNYSYSAVEDDLDEFKHIASEFSKNMSPYITGLPFHFNGRDTWIKAYSVADETIEPSFCKDKTAASIKVTKDLTLINKTTGDATSFGQACLVAAYFRWEGYSAMMAMVVPNESAKEATDMMSYMVSSVSSIPHKVRQTKDFEYEGIKTVVPAEFEASEGSGNILRAPTRSLGSTAGMVLAVFEVPESLDVITEDYFRSTYTDKLATALVDPSCRDDYDIAANFRESPDNTLVDAKKAFYGDVNILAVDEDYISAKNLYGVVAGWYIDANIVERNGKNYLVAALYPPVENRLGIEIEKKMIENLAVAE